MTIGPEGLATVIIELDAHWLSETFGVPAESRGASRWVGGDIGRQASRLARAWLSGPPDDRRFAITEAFLRLALRASADWPAPPWLENLEVRVGAEDPTLRIDLLAELCGVSGPWLGRAYRHWRGEGLGEALRRRRVTAAAILLEAVDVSLAEVAAHAGFCDQSHMNRTFRRFIGRTPAAVRAARLGLSA